ncbi:MAG: DNA-binding response regulator, partial [Planctomycetota bacterium]
MMTTNTARADSSSPNSAQSSNPEESISIANPSDEVVIYLVDDQQIELDLMRRWCEKGGYVTETFDRPEVFLKCVRRDVIGCVVA